MDHPEDEFDNAEQEPLVLRFQWFVPENEYRIAVEFSRMKTQRKYGRNKITLSRFLLLP